MGHVVKEVPQQLDFPPSALQVRGWTEIYTQRKGILESLSAFCEPLASIPLLNKPALAAKLPVAGRGRGTARGGSTHQE